MDDAVLKLQEIGTYVYNIDRQLDTQVYEIINPRLFDYVSTLK